MLLSIVIPVYNVEKYLQQCIDSVLAQNYTDFQIILVNDGSTDGSGKLCDDYAKNENRIEVIHQSNKGLSEARNNGLKIARGDYIWFIDSDDWIVKNAINTVVEELKKEKVEMLGFSMIDFKESSQQFSEPFLLKDIETTNGNNFIKKNEMFYAPVCSYIYQSSFIKKYQFVFKENIIHEDEYFNLICFSKVKKIKKIAKTLYYYRRRDNSVSSSKISIIKINSTIELVKISIRLRNSELDYSFIENQIFNYICSLFGYLNKVNLPIKQKYRIIKEVKLLVAQQAKLKNDSNFILMEKYIYNVNIISFYFYINYFRLLRYYIEAFIKKITKSL
ncbi:glycosyltransferase family 2 protein [Lutibacter flavus]|uniref:Glycosyltransferase involved in cell wall bisynthesis n=1 Tax=Lutibacter flavus TaxID=691689 RepID=A0A238YY55_9FLAO|nr:glycosyltransferase family 2 protein [Lutibacter flavus]SNR76007.1 Glycosyltransferase involved in cell wall bisynthesis [Lutibacter flavus]